MKSSTQVSPIVVPPARRISSAGRSRLLMLAVLPTAALLLPQLAHAVTTDTWTGAAGVNWNTVNNWSTTNPAGVPLPGDSLLFSSGPASSNNNFIAGTAFGSITFDSSAPAYSLTGNALILGNSPFNGGVVATNAGYLFSTTNYDSLVNNSSNLQTISAPITLSALSATASTGGLHNIIGGAAGITLNGAFTRSFSSTATFSGLVNVGASGIANNAAGIIGGWATYGGDFATVNAGAVTAFTGYVNVNSGPITSNPTSVVKLTGTSSSLNGASGTITDLDSINFLGNVGVNGNTSSTLSMATGQILRLGATGSIFRSDTTSTVGTATPANMIVGNAAGTGVLTAGGPVTDAPGELILNVTNTTSNITNTQSIDDLTINANIANNGAGMVTLVKTGQGGLKLAGNNTFTGNIYINEGTIRDGAGGFSAGNGTIFVSNGAQAYVVTNPTTGIIPNNIVIAGKGRYEGQSTIPDFLGGAIRMATAGTNWTGCITLSDDARITARGSTGSPFSTISGKITGAYQLELGGAASGNLTLSNPANDWSGGTMISSGTLRLGANDVIPNGPGKGNLIMNGDGLGNTAAGTPLPTIFDLNGHSETVNGLADGLTNTAACITNSGAPGAVLTIGDNNASATYSGQIAGTAGIAKIGSGTQTLANSLAYSGPTTVSGGTLAISFLNNTSVITVNSPGTLDTSAAGSLSLQTGQTIIANGGTITTNVSVSSGAFMAGSNFANNSVSIDGGSVSPGATALAGVVGTTSIANLIINNGQENVDAFGAGDNLTVTNTLNVNGTFNILINANPIPGTYTIIQAATINGISNIALPVTNLGGITLSLVETANTVKLVVTGALLNLTWNNTGGTGDGNSWNTTQQNWHNGAANAVYIDGSNVTFDDTTSSGNYTVNINSDVSPHSIIVNNSAGDYTFNGSAIAGAASIIKNGSRALTLNNSNSYSGGTLLNLGTLNINNNSALGTGPLSIAANTTIDNTSGSAVILNTNAINLAGNFTFTGAADASHDLNLGTGAVALNANTTINVAGAGSTLTLGGLITGGTNSLNKSGPGTLAITNANFYTGPTTVNAGTLRAGSSSALGSGDISVTNATLIMTGSPINNITLSNSTLEPAGGTVTFGGNITLAAGTNNTFIAGDPLANTVSLNGNLTGILHGSGNLTILQPAGYTGTSDAGSGFRLIAPAATSDFTGNITVGINAKFELQSLAAGPFPVGGTATIILTPGTIVQDGTLAGVYPEFNVRDSGTGNTTFGNNVVLAPGAGIVEINALGTSAPTGSFITMGNLKIADQQGLMTYLASTQTAKVLQFTSVTMTGGNITFLPKPINFGTVTPGAVGADIEIDNVAETAPSNIIVNGTRTLMLGGTDTFSGNISINSGTVQLRSSTALSSIHPALTFGNVTQATTGTLDLNGFNATIGGLTDLNGTTANLITNSAASTTGTLTFSTATSSFAGVIQDGAGITALSVTTGTLTLASPATYSGNTNTNAGGTLSIPSTSSLNPATNVTSNGTINFANASQSIASLNSTTGGAIHLNTTVLTVTNGGSFAGTISDAGTNAKLIIPASTTLATGAINLATLEVDGRHLLSSSSSPSKINSLLLAGSYGGSASSTTSLWTASLDLTNSKLIVEDASGSRAADLAQLKNQALLANTANSTVGIYSSTAAAFNTAAGKTVKVVAVSDNAVRMATFPAGSSNFGGINNVDTNSILIAAVFKGDANMDGVVDIQDLTDVANHWQQSVTDWSQGDFDGSNFVDISDLTSIANNWQAGVGSSSSLSVMPSFTPSTATPEPTSLALLALGGLILTKRRRK